MQINLSENIFPGNIKMYLQFISFPHIDMTLVIEIIPHVRPEHNYSTSWM